MMIEKYASARNRYKPRWIKLLLVAESPPTSGGYFFFDKTIGRDHLFRETMKALKLWPVKRAMRSGVDKRPLLKRFCSMGFFLIDTCELPVDKQPASVRRATIREQAPLLVERVKEIDPDKMVIVKKTIFKPVKEALEKAGLGARVINAEPIPFPSHGNQKRFRTMIRKLTRQNGLIVSTHEVGS